MAFLNDNTSVPVRKPLLRILSNGNPISGAIRASVRNVGHFHADTFTAEFDLDLDPAFSLRWWGDQPTPIKLDVQIGFDTGGATPDWKSLILGLVDHMQSRIGSRTLVVEGRDLSALLIDYKTQSAYPNKTSSEIGALLAADPTVNLKTDITATKTLTGRYYDGEHDEVTNNNFSRTVTAWDLLTNLAQKEHYDLYVSGEVLHFHPAVDQDPTPWLVKIKQPTLTGNVASGLEMSVSELSVDRALTLAKDVVVTVQSWNSGTGKKIRASYPSSGNAALHKSKSNVQPRVFNRPNLKDMNEALQLARSYYDDIVKNERIIDWREPGQIILSVRNMVQLVGTDSSWDGLYFIDTITRSIDFESGFHMEVRAKNKSTEAQVAL